jgi:hypothetical protein
VNWISVNNGLGSSTNFRAIEVKGNTIFAAGQVGTGVFRSTDFGANWSLLGGGLGSGSYRGFASNSQVIVAGSFGGGVFYSTDNGNKWTTINEGLSDLTIFDLDINDSYLIAATNTQGIFRFPLSGLNLPTGISDYDLKNAISIFPNPTTNQLNVNVNAKFFGMPFKVFDNAGKVVFSDIINKENTLIEMRNFPKGIYMLSIGISSKQTFKVIKQ